MPPADQYWDSVPNPAKGTESLWNPVTKKPEPLWGSGFFAIGVQRNHIPLVGVWGDSPQSGEMSQRDRGDGAQLGSKPPHGFIGGTLLLFRFTLL